MSNGWGLATRLARRELRGGLAGFRIFLACLTLGVAAIAAIGSISASMRSGMDRDAQLFLGGDVDLRLSHRPASEEQWAYLRAAGKVSEIRSMRSMVKGGPDGERVLVEVKSADEAYPLVGAVEVTPDQNVQASLSNRDGTYGAFIAPELADRLTVSVGDTLTLGNVSLTIRGIIAKEPDQHVGFAVFGPRLLISSEALAKTGLITEGSLIRYHYRVVLPQEVEVTSWIEQLKQDFPKAAWRIRSLHNASPGLERFMDRVTQFMRLVGLTALLIGGIGIANAVKSYLERRATTIATLKCLGAPGAMVFRVYLIQIAIVATLGIIAGLALGSLAPLGAKIIGSAFFPFDIPFGFFAKPLAVAAAFGLLVTAVFTIWPLGKAQDIKAAHLFRSLIAPPPGMPKVEYLVAVAFAGLGVAALTILADKHVGIAIWFLAGSTVSFLLLAGAARLTKTLSRKFRNAGSPELRMALANLHRPGAPTTNIALSLGLGLSVLVAVNLIHDNLTKQLLDQMPSEAPSYFFIDIQPHQKAEFEDILNATDGVSRFEKTPMIRGKVIAIDGKPVDQVTVAPEAEWVVASDRGLTYAAVPPEKSEIIDGDWWPEDYSGKPLISVDKEIADGFGVEVGDTVSFNILGREITAEIANLRKIEWGTMGMNFVFVFAPGTLDAAPHSFVSTVYTDNTDAERAVRKSVTDTFANISAIRVKDALDQAYKILDAVSAAIFSTASITLVAGVLVLGGAVLTDQQSRLYDSTVFKVLGATRRKVITVYMLEYGLLGFMTAVIAAIVGSVAAWAVVTFLMRASFTLEIGLAAATATLGALMTIAFGVFSTWRALGIPAARMLRVD